MRMELMVAVEPVLILLKLSLFRRMEDVTFSRVIGGVAILRRHLHIVSYVDGWLEGGKGDGVEDVAPWLIFRR